MIERSLDLYDSGAITGHECAIDSLRELDPADPAATLQRLPAEVLDQVIEIVKDHQPGRQMVATAGPVPREEQLAAAKGWVRELRRAGKT